MQRTKIEWIRNKDGSQGYSWNPFSGCLNGCEYCYARKIANRFQPDAKARQAIEENCAVRKINQVYLINNQIRINGKIQPFPFGFAPTYHKYRLEQPSYNSRKLPSTIFVNDMSDIMGKWFEDWYIQDIIDEMEFCRIDTFLLLTKNPKRYFDFKFPKNVWLGQTIDGTVTAENFDDIFVNLNGMTYRNFVSFEPLIENYTESGWKLIDIIQWINPRWVIVGAQTNPAKLRSVQDVRDIVQFCKSDDFYVAVFMKNNLQPFFLGEKLIQEFPSNYFSEADDE